MNRITLCYLDIIKSALLLHIMECLAKIDLPYLHNDQTVGRLRFTLRTGETLADESETLHYLFNQVQDYDNSISRPAPALMVVVDKVLEDIRGIKVEVIK